MLADERPVSTLNHYLSRLIPAELRMEMALKTFLDAGDPEIHLLYEYVSAGDTVIDVGAHLGCYSTTLARITGSRGRVIAVEPQAALASMLRRGADRLNLGMDVMNCAMSDRAGLADLSLPNFDGEANAAHASLNPIRPGHKVTVRTATLDALRKDLNHKVTLVKIDVEGHELSVLRGGEQFLRNDLPILLIEIEQQTSPAPIQQTFKFLQSLGYAGYFYRPGGYRHPLCEFDAARDQQSNAAWTAEYINNFFFLPDH